MKFLLGLFVGIAIGAIIGVITLALFVGGAKGQTQTTNDTDNNNETEVM